MAKTVQSMSANDRLKQSFESKFALSLILATCVHLFVFVYFPEMTVDVRADLAAVAVAIIPMEEIAIPVAPEPLANPAVPVAAIDVDATATIAPTPSWHDVTRPPPPLPSPLHRHQVPLERGSFRSLSRRNSWIPKRSCDISSGLIRKT